MCTVYYRKVVVLTEVLILATPPETCGGGYCDNNTWVYSLPADCGQTYTTISMPIRRAFGVFRNAPIDTFLPVRATCSSSVAQ